MNFSAGGSSSQQPPFCVCARAKHKATKDMTVGNYLVREGKGRRVIWKRTTSLKIGREATNNFQRGVDRYIVTHERTTNREDDYTYVGNERTEGTGTATWMVFSRRGARSV